MTTTDKCVLSSSKLLNLFVFSSRNVVISLIVGIWILSFIIAFVPIYTNIYTTREFTEGRDPCRCDFVVNEWSVRALEGEIILFDAFDETVLDEQK